MISSSLVYKNNEQKIVFHDTMQKEESLVFLIFVKNISVLKKIYRLLLIVCCLYYVPIHAQPFPKDYFRNPLNIMLELAGNFGECRPNHFHTGLDFKTQQKENLPIHAAADGYVSRINVSHSGYGYALYIDHPNGYQTVYAHLNGYSSEIQAYLTNRQYEAEKWNVDVLIPEGVLPVRKGAVVALSGNTGGSTSPHLHFEIREIKTGWVVNPALFGFDIPDIIAPVFKSIAIYNADKSIYQQKPTIVLTIKSGDHYSIPNQAMSLPFSNIRIGILADDYMNGSHNFLGIYKMELIVNKESMLSTRLDKINFDQNRYMNAYADFKTYKNTGKWYQALYKLPNNRLEVYEGNSDGIISLNAAGSEIAIQIADVYGNQSMCKFTLSSSANTETTAAKCSFNSDDTYEIGDTHFQFRTAAAYIYDPICWEYKVQQHNQWATALTLLRPDVPLHTYSRLALRLKRFIPFEWRSKMVMVHKIKASTLPGAHPQTAMPALYENGWAVAEIRTFGDFEVAIDTVPPRITSSLSKSHLFKTGSSIHFTLTESLTDISQCSAYIDGKWVCFSRKNNTYSFKLPVTLAKGNHNLRVIALDENQNKATKEWQFTIQ